jgi:PPOX class probable F420-dependent enzyme
MTMYDEETVALLDGNNFASLATVNADGAPQSSVVWFLRDGDAILFSVLSTRRKARNMAREPRVSVSIYDLANPYHSVEIRGTAELIEDVDKQLPRRLSHKYLGTEPPAEPAELTRLMVRVTPTKVSVFSA